ncbi:MAG: formyltransferase family protein [Chthoniobacter sp.]
MLEFYGPDLVKDIDATQTPVKGAAGHLVRGEYGGLMGAKMRAIFMGTGEIGVPALTWLLDSPDWEVVSVVSQPDKPVGRKQELKASAIKELALQRGVPVLQPVKMRASDAVEEIAALRADVIVVMAYGQILPKAVLDAPRLACLNLHASLLPRWRGAAPIQAAIEAGDPVTGVTVMYMAAGLDTGDILLMRETPITATDTGAAFTTGSPKSPPARSPQPCRSSPRAPRRASRKTKRFPTTPRSFRARMASSIGRPRPRRSTFASAP